MYIVLFVSISKSWISYRIFFLTDHILYTIHGVFKPVPCNICQGHCNYILTLIKSINTVLYNLKCYIDFKCSPVISSWAGVSAIKTFINWCRLMVRLLHHVLHFFYYLYLHWIRCLNISWSQMWYINKHVLLIWVLACMAWICLILVWFWFPFPLAGLFPTLVKSGSGLGRHVIKTW